MPSPLLPSSLLFLALLISEATTKNRYTKNMVAAMTPYAIFAFVEVDSVWNGLSDASLMPRRREVWSS